MPPPSDEDIIEALTALRERLLIQRAQVESAVVSGESSSSSSSSSSPSSSSASDFIPASMLQQISLPDIKLIFDRIISKLENNENVRSMIAGIQKYSAIRFPKNRDLPRTSNLLVACASKTIQLVVDTKSKTDLNTKNRRFQIGKGVYSEVKTAYRFDLIGSFPAIAGKALAWKNSKYNYTCARNEVHASREINSKFVTTYIPGLGRKITENLFRFVIYSTRLKGNLYSLIKSKVSLSDRQKHIIARELLLGLKDIHDKGYVHSDIKLENILYCYDEDTDEYHIQISDLGLARQFKHHDLRGTPCMFSPALFKGNRSLRQRFDIRSPDIDEASAIRCSHLARVYSDALSSEDNPTYYYNTAADDLWAAGITLYSLFFNDYPAPNQELFEQRFETHPWLRMLLTGPRPTATLDVILETLGETPLVELGPAPSRSFLPCFDNAQQVSAEISPPPVEVAKLENANTDLKPN